MDMTRALKTLKLKNFCFFLSILIFAVVISLNSSRHNKRFKPKTNPMRSFLVTGGVIQQNYPQQGFGWFGGSNQFGNQNPNSNNNNNGPATFPNAPSTGLFQPNFIPPVYFPNNYPYPTFPNMFPFVPFNNVNNRPNNNQGGGQGYGPGGQYPQQPNQNNDGQFGGQGNNQNGHDADPNTQNRVDATDDQFLTNAFFNPNQQGTENVHREWTKEDEQKWQATTKRPYFENKVPGLECTLPASAVLGATTALKASSLLPLNVPIGKPILSCNATELLQAQINLDGIIYDCNRSAITMSCPRVGNDNLIHDECHGESLECDVRMKDNTRGVTCTNGTLISNQEIVCKSATLMPKKNVLNCLFKNRIVGHFPSSTGAPPRVKTTTERQHSDDATTVRPVETDPYIPPPVQSLEDLDARISSQDQLAGSSGTVLTQDVKRAMNTIFPHELLSISESKMYLPPKSASMGRIPDDLRSQMLGVFPHDLFAMSHTVDENSIDNDSRLSVLGFENINNPPSLTQRQETKWDVNANRPTVNSGTSTKTKPHQLPSRFGGDDQDRHIFSP